MTNMVADTHFRADVATDGHPLILIILGRSISGAQDKDVADVLAHGPLTGIVDQVGVFFRSDPLQLTWLSSSNHVRLPQQDVHLHGLAHVRGLAIWIRQLLRNFRSIRRQSEQHDRGEHQYSLRTNSRAHGSLLVKNAGLKLRGGSASAATRRRPVFGVDGTDVLTQPGANARRLIARRLIARRLIARRLIAPWLIDPRLIAISRNAPASGLLLARVWVIVCDRPIPYALVPR